MDATLRNGIKKIIQKEVVLATGCTEPVAVALVVTKAREVLGCMPEKVEVRLSKNIFKNAMGVGIPGTGMIGLPIAIAMGLVGGKSEEGLKVLTMPQELMLQSKEWLANNSEKVNIEVIETPDKLYAECICSKGEDHSRAIIAQQHTNFILIEKNGDVILQKELSECSSNSENCEEIQLSARMVYEYATTAPIEEISFLMETVKYNNSAAEEGLKGYGLNSGKILMENANGDIVHTVVARTVAASDARMDGCTKPVYSNSGSGNQGICCTLPVYNYGLLKGEDEEHINRALVMSHLMSIYIKKGIGRLSALCGIVNASIGTAAGITYLHHGSFEQICFTIRNLINTIAGMVCDGAKPSCALKMSTGLYSAFVSSELAIHNKVVDNTDGISEEDVDYSIANLGKLGHDGMNDADNMILNIMTHKHHCQE